MKIFSFQQLVDSYRIDRLPSPETVKQMEVVVRSLGNCVAVCNIYTLERDEVIEWRDWLLEVREVSRHTWNNYRRHLNVLLNYAVEAKHIGLLSNPLNTVRGLSVYQKGKKSIDPQDVRVLTRFLSSEEGRVAFHPAWFWSGVIRVLYYTGMRRKQLVNLKWEDVDFRREVIRLRAESSKTKREWEVPMPALCRVDLENLEMLSGSFFKGDQVWNVTKFNDRYAGTEMVVGQLSGFFRRLQDKSGVAVSSHRFRHSFGTQAAATGEIKQVQSQLGHTTVSTTLEYVQPDLEGMKRVGGALEGV